MAENKTEVYRCDKCRRRSSIHIMTETECWYCGIKRKSTTEDKINWLNKEIENNLKKGCRVKVTIDINNGDQSIFIVFEKNTPVY